MMESSSDKEKNSHLGMENDSISEQFQEEDDESKSNFQEDDIEIDQMDELQKQQETKLYKLALKREQECLQELNHECYEKINIFNVPIKYNTHVKSKNKFDKTIEPQSEKELGWIHTYETGVENGQIILLLHGYGNTSMSYYKALKFLGSKYRVYCIDFLGMGLSSRPQQEFSSSSKDLIQFFVDSIEEWRKQMNIKQKIFIAGHCFGGYIATNYAIKYKRKVSKLILINPMGMTKFTDVDLERIQENLERNSGFFQKKILKYGQKMFENSQTPQSLSKKFLIPSNYLLRKFFNKNFKFTDKESKIYQKYMKRVLQLPESTEKLLNRLFKLPNLAAYLPLETTISQAYKQTSLQFYTQSSNYSQFSNSLNNNNNHSTSINNNLDLIQSNHSHQTSNTNNNNIINNNINNSDKKINTTEYNTPTKQSGSKKQNDHLKLTPSDKVMQSLESKSIFSQKNSLRSDKFLSSQRSLQEKVSYFHGGFDFDINVFFSSEEQLIANSDGWKQLIKQNPNIGTLQVIEGGHISMLENYEIYFNMLKYI